MSKQRKLNRRNILQSGLAAATLSWLPAGRILAAEKDEVRKPRDRSLFLFADWFHVKKGDLQVTLDPERITPEGRVKLRVAGITPPTSAQSSQPVLVQLGQPVACPNCGSTRTVLENAFGPTQCRAIHHCTDCRQPFERFKPI